MKCQHKPTPQMLYNVAVSDAERRLASGERQGCCPWCGKWIWATAFFTRTDYLEAADSADELAGVIAYEEHVERVAGRRRK